MKRKITRTKGSRYCTVEIEISNGRLSVCGEEGEIVTRAQAKRRALENWESFFEENPGELVAMNRKQGTRFTSNKSAAKYVLQCDGEFHGIDAKEAADGKICILHSCGQIRETIAEFFPEVKPLLPWHLNDMHAGCEHQEALGWGHGKTIALASGDLTEAQRATIEGDARKDCDKKREKEFELRWKLATSSGSEAAKAIRAATGSQHVSIQDVNNLCGSYLPAPKIQRLVKDWIRNGVEADILPETFDAAIYKDSISAPCPTCGYLYGTAWLKRELPPEIIKLAETVCG